MCTREGNMSKNAVFKQFELVDKNCVLVTLFAAVVKARIAILDKFIDFSKLCKCS